MGKKNEKKEKIIKEKEEKNIKTEVQNPSDDEIYDYKNVVIDKNKKQWNTDELSNDAGQISNYLLNRVVKVKGTTELEKGQRMANYLLYSDKFDLQDFLNVPDDINGFMDWAQRNKRAIVYFTYLNDLPNREDYVNKHKFIYDIYGLKLDELEDSNLADDELEFFGLQPEPEEPGKKVTYKMYKDAYRDLNELKTMMRLAVPVANYAENVISQFAQNNVAPEWFGKKADKIDEEIQSKMNNPKAALDQRLLANLSLSRKKEEIDRNLADFKNLEDEDAFYDALYEQTKKYYNADKKVFSQHKSQLRIYKRVEVEQNRIKKAQEEERLAQEERENEIREQNELIYGMREVENNNMPEKENNDIPEAANNDIPEAANNIILRAANEPKKNVAANIAGADKKNNPLYEDKYYVKLVGKDREIDKDEFQNLLAQGKTVMFFEAGRLSGTVFNPMDMETQTVQNGKTEVAFRNVRFSEITHLSDSLKELKALQKDLLATDPWYALGNSYQFRQMKSAVAETIAAMEAFRRTPITQNKNVLLQKMRELNAASNAYREGKEAEIDAREDEKQPLGSAKEQKRVRFSEMLEDFTDEARINKLTEKKVHDTVEQIYQDKAYDNHANMQIDLDNDIRAIKNLEKQLLATDPWWLWTNSGEFKAIKKSLKSTITAFEQFKEHPIAENRKALVDKTSELMQDLIPYIARKQKEAETSNKSRDAARLNIARQLLEYTKIERLVALSRMDALTPASAMEKAENIVRQMKGQKKDDHNAVPNILREAENENDNEPAEDKKDERVFAGLIKLHKLYKSVPNNQEYAQVRTNIAAAVSGAVSKVGPEVLANIRKAYNLKVTAQKQDEKMQDPGAVQGGEAKPKKMTAVKDEDWNEIMAIAVSAKKPSKEDVKEVPVNEVKLSI